jgi:hypothetical protein
MFILSTNNLRRVMLQSLIFVAVIWRRLANLIRLLVVPTLRY